jgi:deuterolysin
MKNVPRSSRIKGRDVTFDFCSDDQVSQLQTAVNDATSMAGAARDNAPSGNFFYSTWFRDNSQLDKVTSTFSQVTDVPGMGAGISCADPGGFCVDQIIAYTNQPRGPVVPCPLYFNSPALAGDCQGTEGNGDKGGVLLHEFTHLGPALTTDIAYRMEDCRQLSAEDAAINANSYRIYASSVRLGGCS